MQLRLAVSHVIYFVNTKDKFFKDVSYPVLPNAYHLILVKFYREQKTLTVIGTKNLFRGYTFEEQWILQRSDSIFSYTIYSN